jgi:hypothetical protein
METTSLAATIAFERPVDLGGEAASSLRAAMLPADLHRRTGALSATLLREAVDGHVIEPVCSILDLSARKQTWVRALTRLQRIGHGTGRTYAVGCAVAALSLSQHLPVIDHQTPRKGTGHEGARPLAGLQHAHTRVRQL